MGADRSVKHQTAEKSANGVGKWAARGPRKTSSMSSFKGQSWSLPNWKEDAKGIQVLRRAEIKSGCPELYVKFEA